MLHPTRTTQARKRAVSRKTKTKLKKQTNKTLEWKWEDKEKPMTKKEFNLEAEVFVDLDHGLTPLHVSNGYRNE